MKKVLAVPTFRTLSINYLRFAIIAAVLLPLTISANAQTTNSLTTDHILHLTQQGNRVEFALDGEKLSEDQLYSALAGKLSTGIKSVTVLFNSSLSLKQATDVRVLAEKVGFYTRLCTYSNDPEWCSEVLFRGPIKSGFQNSSSK